MIGALGYRWDVITGVVGCRFHFSRTKMPALELALHRQLSLIGFEVWVLTAWSQVLVDWWCRALLNWAIGVDVLLALVRLRLGIFLRVMG